MMIEYGCLNAGMFLFTSSVKVEHGRVTSTKSNIDALVFSKFPILGYPLLDGRQQAPV